MTNPVSKWSDEELLESLTKVQDEEPKGNDVSHWSDEELVNSLQNMKSKPKEEPQSLFDAFKRGAARTAKKMAAGALYMPDVAASIFREPANWAIEAAGGPKKYMKPVGEALDEYIDEKTNGSLKPRNKLEEYEDVISETIGGAGGANTIAKVLAKGATPLVKGAADFFKAGTEPTTTNLVALGAAPSAIKYVTENHKDKMIPGIVGAAGIYGATKGVKKLKSPEMANWIGEKIGFDTPTFEMLNKIPGWDKVQTLGDYVTSPGVKKTENLLRKVPILGSDIEKRAMGKGKMVEEALGQHNVNPSEAPKLALKGADAAEATYNSIVGGAKKEAISATKNKMVPINNTLKFFNNKRSKIKTEGGKETYSQSGLGRLEESARKLQTPLISDHEKEARKVYEEALKKREEITKDVTFTRLNPKAQNQILDSLEPLPPKPNLKQMHKGKTHYDELHDFRSELGKEIDWRNGKDLSLKSLYANINKDLDSYFNGITPKAGQAWRRYNSETTKYLKQSHKAVSKVQKLVASDDDIKAFVSTLPSRSGAKAARIVMKGLGDEAPQFLDQIIHHIGYKDGKWNPLVFESAWTKLPKQVQNELLTASKLPPDARRNVQRIIDAIKPIGTTLKQNLNTSETSTFETIKKLFMTFGSIPVLAATGNYGLAAKNFVALVATKGASKYIFANPKFSAWINHGMNQKSAKGLESWSKGIKHFPDAPQEFKTNLSLLMKNIASSPPSSRRKSDEEK